jgi:hypothetical protein
MSDDWEDWETEEFVPLNIKQLKILEERKLVEESDNALTKELFCDEEDFDKIKIEKQKTPAKNNKNNKNSKISNRKQNEDKLKELSKQIKKNKANKKRAEEIFGESEYYDEYQEYEDKFY